jgi:hypothetical protein
MVHAKSLRRLTTMHVIDLPEDLAISSTFNVTDIFEYFQLEGTEPNSMTSSFQEGKIDARHYIQSH